MSIRQIDDRILVHCFAGCPPASILEAVGLALSELFDRPLAHESRSLSRAERRRYGQSLYALKVLEHEARILLVVAGMLRQGEALNNEALDRLAQSEYRIKKAVEVAG